MTIQNNLSAEQVALATAWWGWFICVGYLVIKGVYDKGYKKGWAKGYARGKSVQSERHFG